MANPNPIDISNSPFAAPPGVPAEPMTLPYATPALPDKKIGAPAAMVLITLLVGAASVFIFLACVVNNQEAWPAAVASGALCAMGTLLGLFVTRGR
ncbi:MAG TPA: hypothetical protein VG269_26415 [Tepidisphaeraceae bacterium]|jgi:hypothetical protein|nr:hypothetical protein [Tepidisphaeraceae bacterium]